MAEALTKARVATSAEVSVGFGRANELISQSGRVDACLIDSLLMAQCLERGRIQRGPRGSELRRIMLAPGVPNSLLVQAAQAGLDDVVDLSGDVDSLLKDLRDSLAGRRTLGTHPLWRTVTPPRDVNTIASPYRDTIDHEIVSMIAVGLTDDEIAKGVYLSCQTVRNRISRMLERSGARNRTHLASVFIRDQYHDLDAVLPYESHWLGSLGSLAPAV
jgi:DNA-binding NarL/FixJ family response regulator